MIEQENDVTQGIDRITQILQRQAQPVGASPLQAQASPLPANILNAIASASYDYGDGGGNFMGNVQKYQDNQDGRELNNQKMLLTAFEQKMRMGDAQAKALDDRIMLFTGDDPEGKALFLQALHEDPESIDPSNSFQVMTKLAGIKKKLGYESPDLQTDKLKEKLQIDLLKSQIGATNALASKRGSEGASPGKPLPISAANIVLGNRENLDKAKKALALIEGNAILTPSGQVTKGDKEATGFKAYLPDSALQRLDKGGVATRAAIADIGSMVIHDRSGAAVSASEMPRLVPFIPKEKDSPDVVKTKLKRFVSEYQALVDENDEFYRESGYNVPENKDRFSIISDDPRVQKALDEGYTAEEIQQYLESQ
jgi:hypothetical protein